MALVLITSPVKKKYSTLSQDKHLVEESCISMMDTFEPFTETDIRQLQKKSHIAFCAVGYMPI